MQKVKVPEPRSGSIDVQNTSHGPISNILMALFQEESKLYQWTRLTDLHRLLASAVPTQAICVDPSYLDQRSVRIRGIFADLPCYSSQSLRAPGITIHVTFTYTRPRFRSTQVTLVATILRAQLMPNDVCRNPFVRKVQSTSTTSRA